ncbi:MAG: STAS/SEC14 domain-containing protein [Bacteroidota bacterium]
MGASRKARTRGDVITTFSVEDLQVFRTAEGTAYAIVGHNPDQRLITDTWLGGFGSEAEFRRVVEFICARFESGGYAFWLVDLRYLNSSFFHSEAWLAESVFPRAIVAGLRRQAIVMPSYQGAPRDYDVFGSASSALRRVMDGRVRGFTDLEEAKEWLFQPS